MFGENDSNWRSQGTRIEGVVLRSSCSPAPTPFRSRGGGELGGREVQRRWECLHWRAKSYASGLMYNDVPSGWRNDEHSNTQRYSANREMRRKKKESEVALGCRWYCLHVAH